MSDEEMRALGWRGDARHFRTTQAVDHERFVNAVRDYAAMLGLDAHSSDGQHWQVTTGTPATHLAADKLWAYVQGLGDALSDSYGHSWSAARMASGANLICRGEG